MRRVRKVKADDGMQRCPTCEYSDGFHIVFCSAGPKTRQLKPLLVCPMCSSVFDIGLTLDRE